MMDKRLKSEIAQRELSDLLLSSGAILANSQITSAERVDVRSAERKVGKVIICPLSI